MASIRKQKNRDRSTSWVARVRVKPFKPVAKSFPTKAAAEAWADELEAELRNQRGRGASADLTTLTLRELVEHYREDPETQSRRYFDSLSMLLAWWVNHYGAVRVLDVNVLLLREARERLRPGRKPATVNRQLSALRSCWNWGRSAGLVPHDHAWPTRLMLTERNERQRYLSDDELDRLLDAARNYSPTMYAAVILSIACGLRQGELMRLRWSDVDLAKQRLAILRTKTETPRSVYLPASAVAALKALKKQTVLGATVIATDKGEPINKGWIRWRWLEIRDAAELRDFRWHDLRHSCASFLAQQGASLLEIGAVLGHRSPAVTRRYAHLVEGAPVTGHDALDSKLRGR